MRVRLMGGPAMNKRVDLPDLAVFTGQYHVPFINTPVQRWNPDDDLSPTTSVTVQHGYYKPSKNPEIWTWVGKGYKPDPWKTYERKIKKWGRDYGKLADRGVPHDVLLRMMPLRPERPQP